MSLIEKITFCISNITEIISKQMEIRPIKLLKVKCCILLKSKSIIEFKIRLLKIEKMITKTADKISNQPQPVTNLTINVVVPGFNDNLKSLKKL